MTQELFAAKPDDLSSIPSNHMMERENRVTKYVLCSLPHCHMSVYTLTYIKCNF